MQIPAQSSWVVRKILGMKTHLLQLAQGESWIRSDHFSVRKLYLDMCGQQERVSWAKMMCQNSAPPKHLFISWLLLNDRLATCQYLQKLGVQVDSVCALCQQEEETVQHLFFSCRISSYIWREVMAWSGVSRTAAAWSLEYEYLVSHCSNNSGKQRMYRCVTAVLIYLIWRERNHRRMKGITTHEDSIIHQCKTLIAICGDRDRKIARILQRR